MRIATSTLAILLFQSLKFCLEYQHSYVVLFDVIYFSIDLEKAVVERRGFKPKFLVIWLEVPFTSVPESQKDITEKDTSVEGKNLGFAIDRQRIIANKEFLAANPVAKRWFERVEIPAEDINVVSLYIKEGEDTPEDIRRHAREWVENHQELFDSWVEEAKNAGGDST